MPMMLPPLLHDAIFDDAIDTLRFISRRHADATPPMMITPLTAYAR